VRPLAILSTLWPKNQSVLCAYAERHPGTTILTLREMWNEPLRQRLAAVGCSLVALDTLVSTELAAALGSELASRKAQLAAALARPGWSAGGPDARIPEPVLAECLTAEASERLPGLLHLVAGLQAAAQRYAVRLLILNEDLTASPRVITAWARQQRIPSLHLSHSLLLGEPYTIHGFVHADVTAVFGERALDGYRDVGVDLRRLRVTGNPAWDDYRQLVGRRDAIRAALADRHGLSPSQPIVVFGTTWSANLSALGDEGLYGKTLRAFLLACRELRAAGVALQAVVKDRQSVEGQSRRLAELLAELEMPKGAVRVAFDDVTSWVVAADVLVSVQSNLSVEAMLAGTPAIDLMTEFGTALGPHFAADAGVVEVEEAGLAAAIRDLLGSPERRAAQRALMQQAAPLHNAGVDGRAGERVVTLMDELALPEARPPLAADLPPRRDRRLLPRTLRAVVALVRERYLARRPADRDGWP
jgi:hypothetical protein